MRFNINPPAIKKIFSLMIIMIALHSEFSYANPFKELKKFLKNQQKQQQSQTQSQNQNQQQSSVPSGGPSATQNNLNKNDYQDDELIKLGEDVWADAWIQQLDRQTMKKREYSKNAAVIDAFIQQYPSLPINYSFNSVLSKNIIDQKYDFIDSIEFNETVTAGMTMGQPDPAKDRYTNKAKIKFKSKTLSADNIARVLNDARTVFSSSTDPLWDANEGMQMPVDINQARKRAAHAAVESYYSSQFPSNINYSSIIEKTEILEESKSGIPVSKLLVTFKAKPDINIQKVRNDYLPGYADAMSARSNFYAEKIKYLEQSLLVLGLAVDQIKLEKIKKTGSSFGDVGIETQLIATEYENIAESGIAKAVSEGTLDERKRNEIQTVNNLRLANAQNLRAKAQKASQIINMNGRSKQGLNQLAAPFIALTVQKRANDIASGEERLVQNLNKQLNAPPSQPKINQETTKKMEDSLGE